MIIFPSARLGNSKTPIESYEVRRSGARSPLGDSASVLRM